MATLRIVYGFVQTADVKLSFSQPEYTIDENELDEQQNFIAINVPQTEQPFNLLLTGMEYTGDIDEEMKATPNVDFKTETVAVAIPAMKEAGPYKISLEDIIIDDNTVDLNEIEKFVLHGEGQEDTICFMDQGDSDCMSTTTKDITINDTDCKLHIFPCLDINFLVKLIFKRLLAVCIILLLCRCNCAV